MLLLRLLLVSAPLLLLGGPSAPALAETNADGHTVLAYYYAWWDPSTFDRTLYRAPEAYNSDDPAMIQKHVQEAQAAGIDGFIMSWYGNGDRTDRNLAQLLDVAQQSGFRATIHFETPKFWGPDDVIAQLRAFNDHR